MVDITKEGPWWRMFKRGAPKGFKDVKGRVGQIGYKTIEQVANTDIVQDKGAKFVENTIHSTVDDIATDVGPITKEGVSKLGIKDLDTYNAIRSNLGKSTDGLLKKVWNNILGRVIDVGTGIAGYIGAGLTNLVFSPVSGKEVDGNDLHLIFAHFMSKALGGLKGGQTAPVAAP